MADALQLDPDDPGDRRIMTLQQRAARQAGREGRDRAAVTRGRPDLEAAFDEGSADAAANEGHGDDDEDQGDDHQAPPAPAPTPQTSRQGPPSARRTPRPTRPRPGSRGRPARWRPSLQPPSRARDAGSFLTGMLAYTLVITYVRYGAGGWKGWLAAKFLNRPMAAAPASGTTQQQEGPRPV